MLQVPFGTIIIIIIVGIIIIINNSVPLRCAESELDKA